MNVIENLWNSKKSMEIYVKLLKILENQWESMKINQNYHQWNSMKSLSNPWKPKASQLTLMTINVSYDTPLDKQN